MKFNQSYYHSMDRGYHIEEGEQSSDDLDPNPHGAMSESSYGVDEIGFGSNPFQRPIEAVNARLKQGVGYIDIPFFGQGKGNKERYTPESISKKERRDIRELAEINEAKISTHASTNIQGLAGLSQGGFNEQQRENTLKEIKKAIDFASDIQGGPVVFHTGEWPRPFSEAKWNKDKMFENYPEEENQATLHMVDKRTGEVKGTVRKSDTLYAPKYATDEEGNIIDIEGNPIDPSDPEQLFYAKPKFNEEGEPELERLKWKDIEQRAKERGIKPEEEFFRINKQQQLLQSEGLQAHYLGNYDELREQREAINEALEFYEQLEDSMPEEEKWKIMKERSKMPRGLQDLGISTSTERKEPSEILQQAKERIDQQLAHREETATSYKMQAERAREDFENIEPIADYGLEKSADTVARAARYAWQKTRQNNPERPIYVSPESFMPEQYGSHPDEIRELIDQSREQFVDEMKDTFGEAKAKELANEHIKGTLDVGHFNMWRQHFDPEGKDLSPEQKEKEFNKWYLEQVEDLVKSGKIGQVHITDNMGFDDEHLSPGEGTVPIDEVMDIIEEADMDDIIVEAGSFNPVDVVEDTFSYFGSPIYDVAKGGGGGRGAGFQQVHQQHFGYNAPPFYVVGAYAPSNEWKLWSEVQLE